jgi:hypothetical membrane protein
VATTPVRVFAVSVTPRRQALLGLASVGTIVLGMVVAAVPYRGHRGEGYSPLNHFVSELGEIAVSRLACAFNLGLVLGGIGLGIFLLLLADRLTGRLRTGLILAGLVALASGTLVGIFPMDYRLTHRIAAGMFFLTGWVVVAVVDLRLLRAPGPGLPRWLLVPGAAVVVIFLTFIAVYSSYRPADPDTPMLSRPNGIWAFPLLEWASLLSLLAWFVCVSIVLLRERPE